MKAIIDLSNPKVRKLYEKFLKEVDKEKLKDHRATLSFNLSDSFEKNELFDAVSSPQMRVIIDEIYNKVFRPYKKHGYSMEIEELIDKCGECSESKNAHELIEKLESIYFEILENNDYRFE